MNAKNYLKPEYLAITAVLLVLAVVAGCDGPPRASYGIDPVHIDSDNFKQLVLANDKPVLVDVWMENCGPCYQMAPLMEELAADFEGKAVVGKLKTDDNPELAEALGIRFLPTVLIYYQGKLVYSDAGFHSKGRMARELQPLVDKAAAEVSMQPAASVKN